MTDSGEFLPFDNSEYKLAKTASKLPFRTQQLQLKQQAGKSTPDEYAELVGLFAFPDDPKGQQLRKKEVLGIITESEQRELKKCYQSKIFSPDMLDLLRRNEIGDPHVVMIKMNEGKAVVVGTNDAEKVLFTIGLGGCTATVIYGEFSEGTKVGIQTHFDPTNLSRNSAVIGELTAQTNILRAQKRVAFIITPEEVVPHPKSRESKEKGEGTRLIDFLKVVIKSYVGDDTEIRIVPYDRNEKEMEKDQSTAVLRVAPKDSQSSLKMQSFTAAF